MRLFVAVRPPERVLDALAGLRRPDRPDVRWTTRAQWHVTLRFLGELADPAPVVVALDGARLPGCDASLGPRVTSLGRDVVMVPVDGLGVLAEAVVGATAGLGRPPDARPFTGHLTLARTRRGAPRSARRALVGEAIEARFPVTDVRLVRSHLGRDGADYEDLHVRALDGS